MRPVAYIDLFCGMGGFSLGARNAGATCILAVDSWDEAVAVHRGNFPEDRIMRFDLGHDSQFAYFKHLVDTYAKDGYHVHIHGSPPCQALSNASRRDASEGMPLVLWFLRLVDFCEPDSWSMENVVPVRKRLPEGTPSVVLNSADFGVPQTRRRCFAGSGWEATTTHAKDEWVSVIDALPHLRDELESLIAAPSMTEQYATASKDKPFPTVTSQSPRQLRLLMDSGRSSAKTTGVNPATGRKEGGSGPLFRELTEPSYTQMSSPRVIKAMINTRGAGQSTSHSARSVDSDVDETCKTIHNNRPSLRLEALGSNAKRSADSPLTDPSKTICGSGNQVGPRIFDHDLDKPQKVRSLTLPETLVLQGFPSDFSMESAKTQKSRWTMVGNAVCPPVAEALIRGIRDEVDD